MATTETKPSETKHWLTPKRIARGPEAARAELRRWSMTAFRPALLKGEHPRDIREAALAAERARGQAEKIAATVTAQEHPRAYKRALSSALAREAGDVGAPLLYRGPEPLLTPGFAVAGLAAVGLGFLMHFIRDMRSQKKPRSCLTLQGRPWRPD